MFWRWFVWLLEAVKESGVFRRNKVSVDVKVRACVMYMAGLSCRGLTVTSGLIPVSHVVVHYWVKALKGPVQSYKPKIRRAIAVGETVLKLNGEPLYVWATIDVDSRRVLAVEASWQRSSMSAEHVLRRTLKTCLNKPLICVDREPWYGDALKSLGLK